MWTELKKFIVGQPLKTEHADHERLTKKKALAVYSSDALSSVAYATEAILFILIATQNPQAALPWTGLITLIIIAILWILILSYRQTISAYAGGGGAYTVCKENLGESVGLVAAAALLLDYILTVAVSIAAGTDAVTSAFPELIHHRVFISITAIFILTMMNLRGVRESGTIFAIPTYIFIFALLGMFAWLGISAFREHPIISTPLFPSSTENISLWILLIAFANGCAALTGVEAISNGVMAFKQPEQKNAQTTLVFMGLILATLFAGVTYFAHVYGIIPQTNETVISQLARHLHNPYAYFLIQASTAGILFLAANTSFNDFPRVTSLLAEDRFFPRQFSSRGDRLVFSNGILGLGLASMLLIWMFNSKVMHLLPLYAIGVFLCFSLSQAGMVKHWFKNRKTSSLWIGRALINIIGCIATSIALLVIVATKFPHGGWIVCITIPLFFMFFKKIHRHYLVVGRQLRLVGDPPPMPDIGPHQVVIPVSGIHRGILDAIAYARSISSNITACYIDITPRTTLHIQADWEKYGMGIKLHILHSPYRSLVRPLLNYIEEELHKDPKAHITVVIPEFVTAKWWQTFLHNQTALFIRAALTFKKRVVVTSVRYHLKR